jgi:S-adenosyl methyltransferase
MDSEVPSQKIDTTVPVSARIWNYWLGGKDYYPVDKEAGDQFAQIYLGIFDGLARPGISSVAVGGDPGVQAGEERPILLPG